MSFPTVYREIKEMTGKTVLQTRAARAIARKAGLRANPSSLALPIRAVTLIDCFVQIENEAFYDPDEATSGAYQWDLDFTGYTHARVSASTDWVAHVRMSVLGVSTSVYLGYPTDFDYDWQDIVGIVDEPGHPDDGQPLRLAGTWGDFGFGVGSDAIPDSAWIILPEYARTEVRVAISSVQAAVSEPPYHQFDSGPFVFTVQAY